MKSRGDPARPYVNIIWFLVIFGLVTLVLGLLVLFYHGGKTLYNLHKDYGIFFPTKKQTTYSIFSPAKKQITYGTLPAKKQTTYNEPIIIVGGGLTGLLIAYQCTKYNIPFVLLESTNRLGGRISTMIYDEDQSTSEGPLEEYWHLNPIVPILQEFHEELKIHPKFAHSAVLLNNGQVLLAEGDGNLEEFYKKNFQDDNYENFATWNNKMFGLYKDIERTFYNKELLYEWSRIKQERHGWNVGSRLPKHLDDLNKITFKDFVEHDPLLNENNKEWIRKTLEPEMSCGWEDITALDGIDEFRIFITKSDVFGPAFGETNYHIQGGNGKLIDALVKRLPKNSVKLNCKVVQVKTDSNKTDISKNVSVTYIEAQTQDESLIKSLIGSKCVVTLPMFQLNNIRFSPSIPAKEKALSDVKFCPYIKIHIRLLRGPATELLNNNHAANIDFKDSKDQGRSLFTLLTDHRLGTLYNSTDDDGVIARGGVPKILQLTCLLHDKIAKQVLHECKDDEEIADFVKTRLHSLFPGLPAHIKELEIFKYPNAVAHWQFPRSRFDKDAQELRDEHHGCIFIGGDSTFGSHSEGAALSAQYIFDRLIK